MPELASAISLIEKLRARGARLVTAESCTAGGVALAIGRVAGASDVLWGGFVVYDNSAKTQLGVAPELIARHGAVSREVAHALAEAALARIPGEPKLAIATTGVAGPGGGSAEKPVGTCWLGVAASGAPTRTLLIRESPTLPRAELQDRFIQQALEFAGA